MLPVRCELWVQGNLRDLAAAMLPSIHVALRSTKATGRSSSLGGCLLTAEKRIPSPASRDYIGVWHNGKYNGTYYPTI